MLSLVMVLQNEEKDLDRALDSVEKKVDEIIIIATGAAFSKSLSIAKRYTDKIILVESYSNYSKLRNRGIKEAKGDWILILDSDEELTINKQQLLSHMAKDKYEGYFITINSLLIHNSETESILLKQLRLFRNKGYYYQDVVNPKLQDSLEIKNFQNKIGNIAGEILHYGYLNKADIYTNISSLEERLYKGTDEFSSKWMLGFYCYVINDYIKASLYLLDSWQMCKDKKKDGLFIALLFSKLLTLNGRQQQNIEFTARVLETHPKSIDIHYQRSISYLALGLSYMAIESLILCERYSQYQGVISIIGGVDSYKTSYLMSYIFQSLGRYKKAVEGYIITLKFNSDHSKAMEGLVCSLKRLGAAPKEIRRVIDKHFDFDSESSYYALAKGMYENGCYVESINILKKLSMDKGKILLAKSLINLSSYKEARDILKEVKPGHSMYLEALYELALICLLTERDEGCNTILKKITLLRGDGRLYAFSLLANNYVEESKLQVFEAMNVFHRIVETNHTVLISKVENIMDKFEELAPYYTKLGRKFEESDQWFLAISNYKKGLQKGFVDFTSAMALGEYTLEVGEYQTAEKLFKKALEINPDHHRPYKKLTELYLLQADRMLKEEEIMVLSPMNIENAENTYGSENLQKRQAIANIIKLLNNPHH